MKKMYSKQCDSVISHIKKSPFYKFFNIYFSKKVMAIRMQCILCQDVNQSQHKK